MDVFVWIPTVMQSALIVTAMIGLFVWRILGLLAAQRAAEMALRERLARAYAAVRTTPER